MIHNSTCGRGDRTILMVAVAVVVAMLALCAVSHSNDSSAVTVSGRTGDCTFTLTDDGVLTITGSGATGNYGAPSEVPWYQYRGSISSVMISDGVTGIGGYAFFG